MSPIFQRLYSLTGTPNLHDSNPIYVHRESLFKMGTKLIFLLFLEELLDAAMWLKL
jgi:hypothetical protein